MSDVVAEPSFDTPLRACPLCGSNELRAWDRDAKGRTLARCVSCGVKFMNPQYSDAWLAHFYSTYISVHGDGDTARWRSRPEVRETAKRRSLQLLGDFVPPGRILMIGCGDGLELRVASSLGWKPEGYDVDPTTTAEVARTCGVPVHCGAFPPASLPRGAYDAVFMDQVIEHPKDPALYLRTAHDLLRPGGALFLGLPNVGSLSNRIKTMAGRLGLRPGKRGRHYATKHHIFYYEPRVMTRLLQRQFGFDVLVVSGSLKPDEHPWKQPLARRFPSLDSSFLLVARKRG
ncbi:MAG: class I SAM-dependent methyltransferase [Planctomycetota bacterium]